MPKMHAPSDTVMWVRSPAGWSFASRSKPMAAPRAGAASRRVTASASITCLSSVDRGHRLVVAAVDGPGDRTLVGLGGDVLPRHAEPHTAHAAQVGDREDELRERVLLL